MFDSLFPSHWTTLRKLMWLKLKGASAVWSTITGNPVSFTAKAAPLRQLEVAFSPVQDLHGYDAPWPAGGGKNKLNLVSSEMTSDGWQRYFPFTIAEGTYTISAQNQFGASESYLGCEVYLLDESNNKIQDIAGGNGSYRFGNANLSYTFTVTSEVAAQTVKIDFAMRASGTTFSVFENAKIMVERGSSATSYAPYSNECPISGWDSLNVEQRGKNLFDKDATETDKGYVSVYYLLANGNLNQGADWHVSEYIRISPNTKITLSGLMGNGPAFCFYDLSKEYISGEMYSGRATITATTPATAAYIRLSYKTDNAASVMLEFSESATEYVPYNGRSISINIGQTVYSGTVDVVTGVVTVTMASVDMGTLTWQHYDPSVTNLPVFFSSLDNCKPSTKPLCSAYNPTWWQPLQNETDMTVKIHPALGIAYVVDSRFSDAATFKTAMSGVILCYELAEPLTIQLTPQEVESLAGDNVMWTDAQNLEVTYRSN